MKTHHYSIERQRKQHALLFTLVGALLTAVTVAGMIYFTYSVFPHRM